MATQNYDRKENTPPETGIHSMLFSNTLPWPSTPGVSNEPDPELVWGKLVQSQALLLQRLERGLKEHCNLDLAQYSILLALVNAPTHCLQLGELARRATFSPSRLNYRVGEMEKRQLITRNCKTEDKRTRHACITSHGLEVFQQAAQFHLNQVNDLFMQHITSEQLKTLDKVFSDLYSKLVDSQNHENDS